MSTYLGKVDFRHPTEREREAVGALVQTVVDEVYGDLWADPPLTIGVTDWLAAWIAVDRGKLVGVGLTSGDRVEDLWIAPEGRGRGTGYALLRHCESEIRARGFHHARLRVVASNAKAISFYHANGWLDEREGPHESFPVKMLEMRKDLQRHSGISFR